MYEELFPSILISYNARLLHINLALFKYEYVPARLLIHCCTSLRKLTWPTAILFK